ncbi:MAG: ABC transporter permease [Christensenellales bacterium]|jgi:putative aldouronate transport system permease protein
MTVMQKPTVNTGPDWRAGVLRKMKRSLPYYALILIPLIILLVFKYYPMYGATLAFKDYKVSLKISGSPWTEPLFRHFTRFLTAPSAVRVITNTLIISLYSLLAGFPIPILLAIGLNELRSDRLRKSLQMVTYMPYFISTVVLVSMIIQFTDLSYGIVNQGIKALGGQPVNFMGNKDNFRHIYVWSSVWQTTGYSAVVYLAALAGVDRELYDAAVVDGASKIKRILHIDLPCIAPTIIVIFILNTGSILSVGFEKIYLMQNNTNLSVSEVISTYVYRMGIVNQNFSYSTAVGLFNSVVNCTMLLLCNAIARKVSDVGLW